MARKSERALLRRVFCRILLQGCEEAEERTITAMQTDGIRHQIVLRRVFARDGAIMGPIPINHQLALIAFGDDGTTHRKGRMSPQGDKNPGPFAPRPAIS